MCFGGEMKIGKLYVPLSLSLEGMGQRHTYKTSKSVKSYHTTNSPQTAPPKTITHQSFLKAMISIY
jgi:hypothetical protein